MMFVHNPRHASRVASSIIVLSLIWVGCFSYWTAVIVAQSVQQRAAKSILGDTITPGAELGDSVLQGQINVNSTKIYTLSEQVVELKAQVKLNTDTLTDHGNQLSSIHGQQIAMSIITVIIGLVLAVLGIYNKIAVRKQEKAE